MDMSVDTVEQIKLYAQFGHYFGSCAVALAILIVTRTYFERTDWDSSNLPLLLVAFIGSLIVGALWELLGPLVQPIGASAGEPEQSAMRFDLLANTILTGVALWVFERLESPVVSNGRSANYSLSLLQFMWSSTRLQLAENNHQPTMVSEKINAK